MFTVRRPASATGSPAAWAALPNFQTSTANGTCPAHQGGSVKEPILHRGEEAISVMVAPNVAGSPCCELEPFQCIIR